MNLRRTSIRNFKLLLPLFVILFAQAIINAQAPPNSTFCANDFQVCAFDGEREVIYGANGTFVRKVIKGGSVCLPETFGIADPLLNVLKSCYIVNAMPNKVVRLQIRFVYLWVTAGKKEPALPEYF